jgi:hypothetical protein
MKKEAKRDNERAEDVKQEEKMIGINAIKEVKCDKKKQKKEIKKKKGSMKEMNKLFTQPVLRLNIVG